MTIKQYIEEYISDGFTDAQARSLTAQQIILLKIAGSTYADKVLLKGGVVMHNITKEQRRSTIDLDFDFVRFDIRNIQNIKRFINTIDKSVPQYHVRLCGKIEDLHHQDYKGKRVKIIISDETESLKFKMDIGVHTLFAINQEKMCFSFGGGNELFLFVNPPEQMFAEKLFSLAKIGTISERFKDIDDMYYLIKNKVLNINIVRKCLELITIPNPYGMECAFDVTQRAEESLDSNFFAQNYLNSGGTWLHIDFDEAKRVILNFIHRL